MQLPEGYGYPISQAGHVAHDLHVHEPPLGHRQGVRRVQHDGRHATGRDAGQALLAGRRELQGRSRSTTSPAAAARARSTSARWSGRCRRPAGSWPAAATCTAAAQALKLRRPECPNSAVYTSRPVWGGKNHPFYKRQTGAARAGPDPHDRVLLGARRSARRGREGRARGRLRRQPAAHARDGDHGRVPGARRVRDRSPAGRVPNDFVSLKKPKGRSTPPPFRVPIVGRRGGKAVNIAAPPGRRVSLGRGGTVEVGDLFFKRPNVSLRAGGTRDLALRRHRRSTTSRSPTARAGSRRRTCRTGGLYKKKLTRARHLPALLRPPPGRHDRDDQGQGTKRRAR